MSLIKDSHQIAISKTWKDYVQIYIDNVRTVNQWWVGVKPWRSIVTACEVKSHVYRFRIPYILYTETVYKQYIPRRYTVYTIYRDGPRRYTVCTVYRDITPYMLHIHTVTIYLMQYFYPVLRGGDLHSFAFTIDLLLKRFYNIWYVYVLLLYKTGTRIHDDLFYDAKTVNETFHINNTNLCWDEHRNKILQQFDIYI